MGSKRPFKLIIFIVVLGAILLAIYETFFWFTHVYENDARVQTKLTNISSQVNGKIERIIVKEGEVIKKDQPLVKLLDDDIRLSIKALKTELALKKVEKEKLILEKRAFETELNSKLRTQNEKIKRIQLEYQSVKDRMKLAGKNVKRVAFLYQKELIPEEKLIAEKDKFLVLKGDVAIKAAQITVAKRELQEFQATSSKSDVITEKIKILEIQQMRIRDSIEMQKVELSYRTILSPIDGVVGRVHRYRGEYVEDGVDIITLHNPAQFWIEAYVDESQIRHVLVGMQVLIDFESYPFRDFYGVVTHVGNLTTAQTGLRTRSSGSSFGGNVERVPVRININDPPKYLTPGMQASVNIRIYESIELW
ncbi:MAG: hypothetical protein CMM58_07075 [Rhodospirillaceae bacterium]|nr:hypothetical protein [Rhodospirillaceae bacterium]